LGVAEVVMANDSTVKEVTGAPVGYVGPVGLGAGGQGLRIVGDLDVKAIRDGITGANEPDHHIRGVSAARDLGGVEWADLRVAAAGDGCPRCGKGPLTLFPGIEVGHLL